ncbi:MAG: hypothetical protein ACLPNY_18525 [Roseiarcus sp.]
MPESAVSNATRGKSPQRLRFASRIAPVLTADRILGASGVVIACSSLAFAGYMLADKDRPPRIAGMEYLSIFARPSHSAAPAAPIEAPVMAQAANPPATQAIDPTPTGSILDQAASGRPVNLVLTPMRTIDARAAPSSYSILDVANGQALVASESDARRVKVGDVVPDFGRINAIEKRGDHWVVLIQNGAPLEWREKAPAAAKPPAPKKKISRQ